MSNQFLMIDIETLGTPRECKSNFIAMPSAAFILWNGFTEPPGTLVINANVQAQLDAGARVNAKTIAFWMGEALHGNPAAQGIIDILNDTEHTGFTTNITTLITFSDENPELDAMEVAAAFIKSLDKDIPVLGNGPEFDLSIFESVYVNLYGDEELWNYTAPGSARTYRDMYISSGEHFNSLRERSYIYATETMLKMQTDMPAVRHDPLFDALAEAFTVASIREHFGIK